MAKKYENTNYICEHTDKEPRRMGAGKFANMPQESMIKKFPDRPCFRDGVINGFTCDISELSDIEENGR